jgi:hypothetical protein
MNHETNLLDAWCPDCQAYQPASNFYHNKSRSTGVSTYCKTHHQQRQNNIWHTDRQHCLEMQRRRYHKNPEYYNAMNRRWRQNHQDHFCRTQRNYRQKNRERCAEWQKKSRARANGYIRISNGAYGKILHQEDGIYTIRLTRKLPTGDRIIRTRLIQTIE